MSRPITRPEQAERTEQQIRRQRRARELSGVHFLGRLNHAELVAAYRTADVFVSMSEHEGFGVPLIEAMAAELPVLAFGAAAVPETLGGAGSPTAINGARGGVRRRRR